MTHLSKSELNWIGVRFLDPIGRVFEKGGLFYRAIYPEKVSYVDALLSDPNVNLAVEKGLLVRSRVADFEVDGFGMVLVHESTRKGVSAPYWSRSQLVDAAECYIALNEIILKSGYGIADGHLGNFAQFADGVPKWIDFGSIVKLSEVGEIAGLSEFENCLYHPLLLMREDPELINLARLSLAGGGISSIGIEALRRFQSATNCNISNSSQNHSNKHGSWWRLLKAWKSKLNSRIEKSRTIRRVKMILRSRTIAGRRSLSSATEGSNTRLERLHSLRQGLPKFEKIDTTWSNYHNWDSFADFYKENPRAVAIEKLVKTFQPHSVADLGANSGFFSVIAAREGCSVFAMDQDESAVDAFYKSLRERGEELNISLAVYNLTAFSQIPNRHDMVFALALTHHLSLTYRFPFSAIAEMLSSYCRKTLITEFMPNGLGVGEVAPNPLPSWYTLENFLDSLSVFFRAVEINDYPANPDWSPRTMVIARDPLFPD